MKNSQKNRKVAKGKRIFIEILKIFSSSFKISIGVTGVLLVLNSVSGGFIGFKYYLMLVILMTISLAPCWILCDSKRIFNNKVHRNVKTNSTNRRNRSNNNTIKRKKIS